MKKVHVNVGTIGHIDHGKTTLTAAILAVQAHKGLAEFKSYKDIAKGGTIRDENKTVTIITSHVEYETAGRGRTGRRQGRSEGVERTEPSNGEPGGVREGEVQVGTLSSRPSFHLLANGLLKVIVRDRIVAT